MLVYNPLLINGMLNEIGKILVKDIKTELAKVSKGRFYWVNITRKQAKSGFSTFGKSAMSGMVGGQRWVGGMVLHQASLPGDPANNMTGALSQSVKFYILGSELEVGYGIKVRYGKYLEDPKVKERMRPNVRDVVKRNEKIIKEIIKRTLPHLVKWER